MGVGDKVPPNLKFAILGLTIPIFTLYILALVGCVSVSPGIPSIYLFLLQVNKVTLRVGYFAVCAVDAANSTRIPSSQNGTANAADGTVCVPTFGFKAADLSVKLFGDSGDVVPILDLALTLQRKILVPIILIAAFLTLFGAIFFGLTKVTQMKLKDPSSFAGAMKQLSIFKPATLATLWMSVCFAFAAAVASTMGVGALNFIIPVLATNITVTSGKLLPAFQYISFIFSALLAFAATLMLSEPLEQQQGMTGEEYPQGEKGLEEGSYDESMMQQEGQPPMEGQEGQEQQPYPEGEYGEQQQQQYAEGQEGQEGQEYDQQAAQQYAEGGEYAQAEYAQQQEQEQLQQQQYQQQQYQQQQQQQR